VKPHGQHYNLLNQLKLHFQLREFSDTRKSILNRSKDFGTSNFVAKNLPQPKTYQCIKCSQILGEIKLLKKHNQIQQVFCMECKMSLLSLFIL